jgi:hypothetical protein
MEDPRPDPRVETAEFAPTRVGGSRRRGWSPLLIVGWAGVLAAVVGLGILGESSTRPAPGRVARGSVAADGGGGAVTATTRPTPTPSPEPTSGPLAYTVSVDGSGLTITGTSVAHRVVWAFVSVHTANGEVLGWRSIAVDDPDGGIRPDRSPTFRTRVPVPAAVLGSAVIVDVTAYDDRGRSLGTVRSVVLSFGRVPPRIDVSFVR